MKKLVLLSVLLAGCGIGDALKDAAEDIKNDIVNSALQAAIDGAISGAEQAGGAGAVVTTAGATVEVTDPESPLFGASVVLVADSLPTGVTQAVLTIMPGDASAAGFRAAADTNGDDYVTSGPAISVELKSIPTAESATNLEVIQPTKDAQVTVPYADPTTGAPVSDEVMLAHLVVEGGFDVLESTANDDKNTVSGASASFSPFVAVRNYAPQFSVVITDATGELCSKTVRAAVAPIDTTYTVLSTDNNYGRIELTASGADAGFAYRTAVISPGAGLAALPDDTTVDLSSYANGDVSLKASCGSELVEAAADVLSMPYIFTHSVLFSGFVADASAEAINCDQGASSDLDCSNNIGTLNVDFTMSFSDFNGEKFVTVQYTGPATTQWMTFP